jgi:hypothetical protein
MSSENRETYIATGEETLETIAGKNGMDLKSFFALNELRYETSMIHMVKNGIPPA